MHLNEHTTEMMAEIVTVHFVDKESTKWKSYAAYVYDKTITGNGSQPWVTDKWPGQKVTNSADIETLSNGYKVVTWKIDLKSCALSNALIIFNNQDNGKQYPASGQPGKEVENGCYYYSDGTTSTTPPSEGSGSGSETTYPTISVKSNYGQNWDFNKKFNFTTTDGKIYTCTLDNVPSGTEAIWFRIVKDGKEYGPGNGSSSDLLLTGTYQQIFEGTSNALKIVPTPGKTSYTITYKYETNQIKYDAPESGSTTDDTWAETEIVLRDVFIPRDIISLVTSSALVVRK